MGKNSLITEISNKVDCPKALCEDIFDAIVEGITNELIQGNKVMLKNFMSFEISERAERKGRNPQTNEVVTFPAVKTVKCKVSKAIKDAINQK